MQGGGVTRKGGVGGWMVISETVHPTSFLFLFSSLRTALLRAGAHFLALGTNLLSIDRKESTPTIVSHIGSRFPLILNLSLPTSLARFSNKACLSRRRRSTMFDGGDDVFGPNAPKKAPEVLEQRRKQIDDYAQNMVRQLAIVLREQFLDVHDDPRLTDATARVWLPSVSGHIRYLLSCGAPCCYSLNRGTFGVSLDQEHWLTSIVYPLP